MTSETTERTHYVDDKHVNFSTLGKEKAYFESLLDQYTDTMNRPKESKEELLRENERNFVEAAGSSVAGPFKYMSKEQVELIHEEIDERLQELEDTGLTRNEILFEDPGTGVKLYDDPFF